MSTFVTTLALDGSADPVQMNLTNLAVGDAEQRQLLIDGFETGDSSIAVTLIAKRDFTDDDDDPNTIQIVASLSTPTRAPNSRLATFVFSSDDTRELALGRVHRVQVAITRSAVAYAKTVATGFVAATQPGSTAVAPSDEATLRAAGDASVLSAITDKIDSVSGTADRITIGGTAKAPTVDIASTYAGQASINTLGTVTTGAWNGTAIDTAHTVAKVASVNGVTDRTIVSGPASAPVVDIASTYPGQTSITTLGTIGTGVWNGTPVAANKGGTGLTGFGGAGALLVAATIATLAVLNPNVTTTKKFLNQIGDGSSATTTAWSPIVSADVSDAASANTASKVVTRDASGNFAANVITANSFSGTHNGPVVGDVTGNTSGTHTGNVVGNASTATTLQTPRTINGVSFNGSANITVTADASTLTGASLNAGVSVLPAQVTGLLSGGLINPALLPALAISETFTVASQAAMLALTAQKGDVAVRSDTSTTFILSGTDPTQLSNWTLLATPVSSVLSVAGKTGVVTLVSADITDATSTNTGSRLVIRDGSGNFAAGTITAALSGNASTATALFNTRTIWGQSFNGTADITGPITATAATISGAINAGTHIRTTGTLTANVASSVALDYAGGFGRIVAQGPDASTLGQFLVTLTKSDGSSAMAAITATSTGVTIAPVLNAIAGVQIGGAASLGATATALISFETPVTRIYAGDGTGYSTRFTKRVGGVNTDLVTITDAGNITATGAASFGGTLAVGSLLTVTQTTSSVAAVAAVTTSVAYTGAAYYSQATRAGSAAFQHFYATSNGVEVARINGDGSTSFAGDLAINTNKFTVAAATGNTTIAGSLSFVSVVGQAAIIGGTTGFKVTNNAVSADNFSMTDAGNVTVRGTLKATLGLDFGSASYPISNVSTQATIGANGGAAALTANPVGYIKITLNGAVSAIIPYYNA